MADYCPGFTGSVTESTGGRICCDSIVAYERATLLNNLKPCRFNPIYHLVPLLACLTSVKFLAQVASWRFGSIVLRRYRPDVL
jgi:hypothetical protein